MAPLHKLQRSVITDYISNLLRAIDAVKSDSAQLRNLVYELARMRVGQANPGNLNEEIDNREQLRLLEMAIYRVEILSRLDDDLVDPIPPVLVDRSSSDALPSEPSMDVNTFPTTAEGELYDASNNREEKPDNQLLAMYQEHPSSFYDRLSLSAYLPPIREWWSAQGLRPIQIWNVASTGQEGSLQRSRRSEAFSIVLSLVTAASVALMAFLITYKLLSDYGNGPLRRGEPAQEVSSPSKTPTSEPDRISSVANSSTSTDSQTLGFPLPTAYGIYAASEGKLIELKPLPISVPDPRIAISATISTPSETVIPTGKVQFIIFRRDTLFAAPDRISIRVVARVARELRFTNNKPTMITKSEGE